VILATFVMAGQHERCQDHEGTGGGDTAVRGEGAGAPLPEVPVKVRLLAGALVAGALLVPLAPASANTGCRYVPGRDLTDPDVVGTACDTAVSLVPDALCTKYGVCFG
jgi:hypothetical protein